MHKIAINRPITTISFALLLVFFGILGLFRVGVSLYPNVDTPVVIITTYYYGADAQTLESKVSERVESAVGGIAGLKKLTSTSADSVSIVVAEFELEVPIERAINDVRDKISGINLGKGIESPIIDKFNIAGAPVLSLFVAPKSSSYNAEKSNLDSIDIESSQIEKLQELNSFVDLNLKPILERKNGVGRVNLVGYLNRQIEILIRPDELARYNLSYNDVAKSLAAQNIELDGGRLQNNTQEWKILTKAAPSEIFELGEILISSAYGSTIKLSDIALIKDSLADARSSANILVRDDLANFTDLAKISLSAKMPNKSDLDSMKSKSQNTQKIPAQSTQSGILLEIQKISGANDIEIANEIKAALAEIQEQFPEFSIAIVRDSTNYIRDNIRSVVLDLLFGAILAVGVVFLFLRNFTFMIIAALSLPVSILGTIALFGPFNQTINLVNLIALTLAIGIIVDDAIVVIENIYQKIEQGLPRKEAALQGVGEIIFALISICAMLLAVFVPIANMSGIVGRFFTSFGISLSIAICISFVVVITLIPMLSYRLIRPTQSRFYKISEPFFESLNVGYEKILRFFMRRKALAIGVVLAAFVLFASAVLRLGVEFIPQEDKSEFEVRLAARAGISLEEMQKQSTHAQAILAQIPEIAYSILEIGYTDERRIYEGKIYVKTIEPKQRKRDLWEIMDDLRMRYENASSGAVEYTLIKQEAADIMPQKSEDLSKIALDITLAQIPQISISDDDSPLQIALYSQDQSALEKSAKALQDFMQKAEIYTDIHTDQKAPSPQISVKIDRAAANNFGISAQEIALALNSAFSGEQAISYFRENGKEYDIILRAPKDARAKISDLDSLTIRAKNGEEIFLSALVEIEQSSTPTSIKRYDRQKSIMILANPARGVSLGEAVKAVQNAVSNERSEVENAVSSADSIESKSDSMKKVSSADSWLQKGANYKIEGYSKYMQETISAFIVAIATTFVIIYMILCALYESPILPLIIIATLPLSFGGAFGALALLGTPLSLFSLMGLMMLMGLVGKNATLIIDVAIEKTQAGIEPTQAAIAAASQRMRPILMTTLAMVFGMLPLALSSGAGNAIKSPLGVAVVGGLLVSMFLSLILVPILFVLLEPLHRRLKAIYE